MGHPTLYYRDFHAWSQEQAGLLRAGELSQADIEHITEEIESMGKTEKRELISRLAVLLDHMLEWRFQADRRGKIWRLTIEEQRRQVVRLIGDSPSLKSSLAEAIEDGYGDAVIAAERETDLTRAAFPGSCPWSFEQIVDGGFWPEA